MVTQTYFSGKWHLGDKPEFYPIEHGFDEMKEFAAYYPGVYSYDDTSPNFHPWFPKYNEPFWKEYQKIVNLDEWEGVAGKPATKVARITYDYLADFDVRQADSAVAYIKQHAKGDKPFFMDVNFMKMHNPTNPAPPFRGKSKLGNYSDSMLELDANVGRIMDTIRAEAPDTIVIITCRQRCMAGCLAGCRRDAVPWREGKRIRRRLPRAGHHVGARQDSGRGRPGPDDVAHGRVADDRSDGRPHTAADMENGSATTASPSTSTASTTVRYVTGKSPTSARNSFIYIDGEAFGGVRADIGGDPDNPDLKIAWKYLWTAKDTWLGPEQILGGIGALYNLTMDPYEKYDMTFNGAMSYRLASSSPGKYSGQDNGWVLSLIYPPLIEFDKSIIKYPNIRRFPGGASNDLRPNLQDPSNPVPAMDPNNPPRIGGWRRLSSNAKKGRAYRTPPLRKTQRSARGRGTSMPQCPHRVTIRPAAPHFVSPTCRGREDLSVHRLDHRRMNGR